MQFAVVIDLAKMSFFQKNNDGVEFILPATHVFGLRLTSHRKKQKRAHLNIAVTATVFEWQLSATSIMVPTKSSSA